MCTVSVVSSNGKVIITSNRDEKANRPAIEPKRYCVGNKVLVFPKDTKAGGTWYAVSDDGVVVVLLNGAAEKHEIRPNYKKSRGLITLEICSAKDVLQQWQVIDLKTIEPFTLVIFFDKKLYQLRWDGDKKTTQELAASENYIWSSSTLYSEAVRQKRQQWFEIFVAQKPCPNTEDVLHFHQYTQGNNKEYGLVIDRDDMLKTTSITQTVLDANKVTMVYHDLLQQESHTNSFIII